MYKQLSKYPVIKEDITIETAKDVALSKVQSIVQQSNWNTKMSRKVEVLDIYQDECKHTTFRLTISHQDRQPDKSDLQFWIFRIYEALEGIGKIPGYKPTYKKVFEWSNPDIIQE